MTSRIFKKASEGGQAGYTLIEIVTALILLGILAAVAVAKYFDMQEEAARIKCRHGQGVLIEQLHTAFAVSKLENNDSFSDENIDRTINEVMASLDDEGCSNDGFGCPKLCPKHVAGSKNYRYVVSKNIRNGTAEFMVKCNVDGHGSTGTVSSARVIDDPTKAQTLIEFLGGLVGATKGDVKLQGWVKEFFINKNGNLLDSEADQSWEDEGADYDGYHSMTAPVLVALQKANIQTDQVIWRMKYIPSLFNVKKGTLYLWVASVSTEDKNALKDGTKKEISTPIYQYTASYNNGTVTVKEGFSPVGESTVKVFSPKHQYIHIDRES